jgi:transposase
MSKKRQYTNEFKREVLELVEVGDRTVGQIARDLDMNANVIYKWRQRYRIDAENDELHLSEASETEAELKRLRRELARVKQEREILKKALKIFSQETDK